MECLEKQKKQPAKMVFKNQEAVVQNKRVPIYLVPFYDLYWREFTACFLTYPEMQE